MKTYICGYCVTGHPCQQQMVVYGETYTCRGRAKKDRPALKRK